MNSLFAFGVFLLERLSPSQNRSALCGDLLQQQRAGCGKPQLFRELVLALAHALWHRSSRFALPVAFSVVWSALYRGYALPQLNQAVAVGRAALQPLLVSPITDLLLSLAPVVSFLWIGLAAFALVQREVVRHLTALRLLNAMSSSNAVLLVVLVLWPRHGTSAGLLSLLTERGFCLGLVNLPIAVSLLTAILCVLPPRQEPPPRRRRRRAPASQVIHPVAQPVRYAAVASSLILLAASLHAQAAPDTPADPLARVERCTLPPVRIAGQPEPCVPLHTRMDQLHIHGVSIAILHNGKVVAARGYGRTSPSTPVTPATLFQAGSISKPVAALAALRLVQQGKLSLDTDVNTYLKSWKLPPNPSFPNAAVTLRELLTHTAGMTVHGFPGYTSGAPLPTLVQVLNGTPPANTPPVRIETAPGTVWNYSGGGFTILQQIAMDVSGQPFDTLLRSTVLQPIGMTDSTYTQPLPAALQSRAATPHRMDGEPITGGAHTYPEQAAAGLWTTPTDLARYILEIQQSLTGKANHVLSPEATQQMLTPGKGDWGLGVQIGGSPKNPYFTHGGVNEGFESLFAAYARTGDGAVIMTDAQGGMRIAEEILRGIAATYHWPDFQPKARSVVEVSPATLARYTGTYSIPNGTSFVITLDGNRLLAKPPIGDPSPLLPESTVRFFLLDNDAEIEFASDSTTGNITHLNLLYGGHTLQVPRKQ